MRKSWWRRSRRHAGWTRTVAAASDRHIATTDPVRTQALLARADHLAGGFVVEASVLARLLGVKLLTLEGVVFASPAEMSLADAGRRGTPSASTIVSERAKKNDVIPRLGIPRGVAGELNGEALGTRLQLARAIVSENSQQLRALDL